METLSAMAEVPLYNGSAVILCFIALAVGDYLLGCFNGAVIVSKYVLRDDVRGHGSGNAGLTNFYRTFGPKLSAVVLACDAVKAVLAVGLSALIVRLIGLPECVLLAKYWAMLFCMLGHSFPCMFHFKGGKGILSGGAAAIMIDWRVALAAWGCFLILFLLTRYVSLGSVSTGVAFPVSTGIFFPDPLILTISILIGGLILWQHRGNIKRLLNGTESKFHFHRT